MDVIWQGSAIISHQWGECKTKELLFSLVFCCNERLKLGIVFVHSLPLHLHHKVIHQLLCMPNKTQAGYIRKVYNILCLIVCKWLTSFKHKHTDPIKCACCKENILQQNTAEEQQGSRSTKCFALHWSLILFFNVLLNKCSNWLISSAPSLDFNLAPLSCRPPSNHLIQV